MLSSKVCTVDVVHRLTMSQHHLEGECWWAHLLGGVRHHLLLCVELLECGLSEIDNEAISPLYCGVVGWGCPSSIGYHIPLGGVYGQPQQ